MVITLREILIVIILVVLCTHTEFTTSPSDTSIEPGGSKCLDCTYSGLRVPSWQVLMDQSFSNINPNMEPEYCDCEVTDQRLCFDNVYESAEGRYRCIVQLDSSPDLVSCPFEINIASEFVMFHRLHQVS